MKVFYMQLLMGSYSI